MAVLCVSQGSTARAGEVPLDGTPLSALSGYIGNWEIDTEWSDGSRLWGRNEFTVGLAGQFINIDTYARDGDGDKYQRYFSVYSADAETGELTAYGFNFDGTVTIVDDIELSAGDPFWTAFVEWVSPRDITFRLDAQRIVNNGEFCRERQRFVGRVSAGILEEIEDQCSTTGPTVSLRINGTF